MTLLNQLKAAWQRLMRAIGRDTSPAFEVRNNTMRDCTLVWTDHKPEDWGCPE